MSNLLPNFHPCLHRNINFAQQKTTMSTKAKIILLADDDVEDQEILEDAIKNFEPVTEIKLVANGQQVIEFLHNCRDVDLPSLIILDYKMPILNAAEVLERIHQNIRFQSIPKVVWSS